MIEPGAPLPIVSVTDRDGVAASLADLVTRPTALVFVKESCDTTRMALPVLAGWSRYEPDAGLLLISQDPPEVTDRMLADLGIVAPVVYDRSPYEASRAFDLPAVPATFMIEDGLVIRAGAGWYRDEAQAVAERLAAAAGAEPVLDGADDLPRFRPG